MVRSEARPPAPGGQPEDLLIVIAAGVCHVALATARFMARLAWWAAVFPMLSVPLILTAGAGREAGPMGAAVVGSASAMILAGWRLAWPASFRRLVSRRIWRRWRRWATYRRPWAQLCALHGLTAVLDERVLVPRLHRVKIGLTTDRVTVQMLHGQTIADWQACSGGLAHAFGAIGAKAHGLKPGWITIDVHHTDTLVPPIPLPPHREDVCLERAQIGITDSGAPWEVRVLGRHLLVAGATGSGKGSVVWSILAALGPAIRDGLVEIWVIDPKGGMEFGSGQALFRRFAYDTGEAATALLREAAATLTARANRLRGVTRLHTPRVCEPLIVLVIDEIATLTAYAGDRKARTELDQLLGLVLSQGRAVGVSVIAAVQDPSKDVLALRQLFPTRIALRLTEPSQVAMVLGDSARDRGGLCDYIPDTLPGVAYVATDGSSDLVRVRAFCVTDHDIDRLCQTFTPTARSFADDAGSEPASAA